MQYKKTTKRKYKRRTSRQILDDECMQLLKEIVRLRDGGCVTEGSWCWGYLTASHWQKRGRIKARYMLTNVNCQCQGCNQRHNYDQSKYDAYMLEHYGKDECLKIARYASENGFKWALIDLEVIRDDLKKYLDELRDADNKDV